MILIRYTTNVFFTDENISVENIYGRRGKLLEILTNAPPSPVLL